MKMESSEDENFDFALTQESVKDYNNTFSSQFGGNVVEEEEVVSLEGNVMPNFDVDVNGIIESSQGDVCDSVQIEDISEDEAVDKL